VDQEGSAVQVVPVVPVDQEVSAGQAVQAVWAVWALHQVVSPPDQKAWQDPRKASRRSRVPQREVPLRVSIPTD
jgi:hypothetical protein